MSQREPSKHASITREDGGTHALREPKKLETKVTKRVKTRAELIAEDDYCQMGFYYKGGEKEFPLNERLRLVDRMYPHAKGGPLYVDEKVYPQELQECILRKAPVMKKLKLRYVVINDKQEVVHDGMDIRD